MVSNWQDLFGTYRDKQGVHVPYHPNKDLVNDLFD